MKKTSRNKINTLREEILKILKTPSHVSYNVLGTVYLKAEQLNKAEFYFKQSLKFNPFYAEAWMGLGEVESKRTNYSEFIRMFDIADKLINYEKD